MAKPSLLISNPLIAFQGSPGAFSHCACMQYRPDCQVIPCDSFSKTFDAIQQKRAHAAILPIRNSIAGRVPDIHQILPQKDFFMIDEIFMPVDLCLIASKSTSLEKINIAYSHSMALRQCQKFLEKHQISPHNYHDTAAAVEMIATKNNPNIAAIASSLSARLNKLKIISRNIQDENHNYTRFLVFVTHRPTIKRIGKKKYITSLLFRVRNVPAALYKALGGFATNHINMLTLESYQLKNFQAAQFYAEIDAHPDDETFKQAIDELGFYTDMIKIIGLFTASNYRNKKKHA